ncbi:hypothetical protein J5N97_010306 [Dioscorea zingiberensis]|uniref:F-box domain-containing protein n=1 Tax=Dioscorea zingiberensis TaxID=325984 RepID=A0A9D5HMN2_9LILI|nr:hypothetical protein J5N97_010306 [Dioscorea zingiberensis]
MKMRMVRWENLPSDIIETISDLLPNGTDYISFRSVCTYWRAATSKKHNIPFLIVPSEISRNVHNVFRVSDQETRRIMIRQEILGKKCCEASHGYLIMVTTVNAPMNIDHLYLVEVDCHLWVALRYNYPDPENSRVRRVHLAVGALRYNYPDLENSKVKKGAFRFAAILMLWAALRYKYPDPENSKVKKGAFRFAAILIVRPMNVAIEEVKDLEGRAFFFGLNQSFWMSTEEHTQLKKNCIYYTNFPLRREDDVYGHQDFGTFDTATHKIERVLGSPLEYSFTWVPSAWLMSRHNI